MDAAVEIRRLTPEMAEDYVRFFDDTPHNGGERCYCVTWRSDASYADGMHWYPTPEQRRERAMAYVRSGGIQGYLAFCGGRAVGWCNVGSDCGFCVDYLRAFWPIAARADGERIRSVFCFLVAPDMRGRGVARQLLARVAADAAQEGFDFVEGYASASEDCHGSADLYESCGFVRGGERDGRTVMRYYIIKEGNRTHDM